MRASIVVLALLAACGESATPIIDARTDSAGLDGETGGDAAVSDAAVSDAAALDDAAPDAPLDAAAPDAPPDAAAPDAAAPDAPLDAAAPDAAAPFDAAVPFDAAALDAAVPTFFGPTPYLQFSDSPFAATSTTLAWWHLEDFENGALDSPGVTASAYSVASSFGTSLIDSVDVDDGVIDGTCQLGCDDLWASGSVTFTFDAVALGGLPTHVGLVWTDGGPGSTVTLEAFDASGGSLGTRSGTGFADATFTGATAEDRFFGVVATGGVRQVRLSNTSGGIEVDHLQYGR